MTEAATTTASTTDTAAATATATTTTAAATTTSTPAAWHASFDDDTKGWLANRGLDKMDGAAALPELVKTARNAEKFIGVPADQIIRLPKDGDPAQTRAIYQRLGLPDKPEQYEVPAPAGGAIDPKMEQFARAAFHKNGLPAGMAKGLMEDWNAFVVGEVTASQQAQAAAVQKEVDGLKGELGDKYEPFIQTAQRAAKATGVTEEQLDQMQKSVGYSTMMKVFHNIGVKLGEDKFVNSDAGGGFTVMTPEAAQQKITALKSDAAWVARYVAGGKAEKEEMTSLQQLAAKKAKA